MGLEPGTSRVVAFSDVPSDGFRVGVEIKRELGIYTRVLSCMSASLSLATKSIIDDYAMPRSRAATEVRNHILSSPPLAAQGRALPLGGVSKLRC